MGLCTCTFKRRITTVTPSWYCSALISTCLIPIVGLVSLGTDNQATKLPDFKALASQIAKVTPSAVQFSSYSPSNSAQACPTNGSTWEASDILPPTPNEQLCGCMVQNLTCVANPIISNDTITTQFSFLYDPNNGNNTGGINANGTLGTYGSYSMCNPIERLSWAMNEYYQNQTTNNKANNNPCDFKGAGKKQTPTATGTCKALISQAGAAGTGVVTSAPSGTGSSSSSTSTQKGAAGLVTLPVFGFGMLQLAAYVTVAALIGAGMVIL